MLVRSLGCGIGRRGFEGIGEMPMLLVAIWIGTRRLVGVLSSNIGVPCSDFSFLFPFFSFRCNNFDLHAAFFLSYNSSIPFSSLCVYGFMIYLFTTFLASFLPSFLQVVPLCFIFTSL